MELLALALTIVGIVVAIVGLKQEARSWLLRVVLVAAGSVSVLGAAVWIGYQFGAKSSTAIRLDYTESNVSVMTYAGTGEPGNEDAKGLAASFFTPEGIDIDSDGIVYVTEFDNNLIRRIDSERNVSVLCGSVEPGHRDGPLKEARFRAPSDVCVDTRAHRLLVAEWGNHCIRAVNLDDGAVTTVAGRPGEPGIADGVGLNSRFLVPAGLDCTTDGVIYVAEFGANRIRKIDVDGTVSVFAGTTYPGYRDGHRLTHAQFSGPMDVLVVGDTALMIADYFNNEIRRIDLTSGEVTTVAGTGEFGMADGTIEEAQIYAPTDVEWDPGRRRFYIVDSGNNAIRILSDQRITTLAGGRRGDFRDGGAGEALFNVPISMCELPGGDWLVTDSGNHSIRQIHIPDTD